MITYMGVPSIKAEEAAASSLLMCVPIASLAGHLSLHIIDRIHDSKSRMWSRSRAEDVSERSYRSSSMISMVI